MARVSLCVCIQTPAGLKTKASDDRAVIVALGVPPDTQTGSG